MVNIGIDSRDLSLIQTILVLLFSVLPLFFVMYLMSRYFSYIYVYPLVLYTLDSPKEIYNLSLERIVKIF